MIAFLRGEILSVSSSTCVVDVNGVGYAVSLTQRHASELHEGDLVGIATTLIVREDSLQLFGFESPVEQQLFEHLLSVSGIGPRSALAVLSALRPSEIYSAVVSEDDAVFRAVSGIGPKTAKLIVVSLAGRLRSLSQLEEAGGVPEPPAEGQGASGTEATVTQALLGLGWNERSARDAVARVLSANAHAEPATVLRDALTILAGGSK